MIRRALAAFALGCACTSPPPDMMGGGGGGGGSAGGGDATGGGSPVDSGQSDGGLFDAGTPDAGPVSTQIQNVQDRTLGTGTRVKLSGEFITGRMTNINGSVLLYIQEPSGRTTAGHTYPEYAGMGLLLTTADLTAFPDAQTVRAGDCIDATGTVSESPASATADVGTTQLSDLTAFSRSTACGSPPVPTGIALSDIATDTNDLMSGNQPGPKAETYEGVLVTVSNTVTPTVVASSTFEVTPQGQGPVPLLEIQSPLVGSGFSFAAGTTFTSITGVYSQANTGAGYSVVVYRLMPRDLGDLSSP